MALKVFSPGEEIKSSEMNDNFNYLETKFGASSNPIGIVNAATIQVDYNSYTGDLQFKNNSFSFSKLINGALQTSRLNLYADDKTTRIFTLNVPASGSYYLVADMTTGVASIKSSSSANEAVLGYFWNRSTPTIHGTFTMNGRTPTKNGAPSYSIYSANMNKLITYDFETMKMTINRNFNLFYDLKGVTVAAGEIEILGGADNKNPMYLFYRESDNKVFAVTAGKGISWAQAASDGSFLLGVVSPTTFGMEMNVNNPDFFEWKNSGFLSAVNRLDYLTHIPDDIIFVGDSITAGSGASDAKYSFFNQLKKGLGGINMYNEGVPSSTWQNSGNSTLDPISLATRVDTIDWTRGNVTVFLLGANDHSYNLPIGTLEDTSDQTMLGAASIARKKIYEINPKMRFLFITPAFKCRYGTYPVDLKKTPNSLGLYFHEYVDAIIDFAKEYGYPCLDLYRTGNVNNENWEEYIPDGVHWNDYLSTLNAVKIGKFISTNM